MEIALLMPCYQPATLMRAVDAVQAQLSDCVRLWPQARIRVWLIDDGAAAAVTSQIAQIKAALPDYHSLTLSRHFGYEAAVQAGLATIAADAYLVIDPERPAMFASIPTLLDALLVGGYAIVGFSHKRRTVFRNCALTAVAKRALLQATAQDAFTLDSLATIGFRQKRLLWHGPLPPRREAPRLLAIMAVVTIPILSWWPPAAIVLNMVLFATLVWQWRPRQRVPYIVSKSD